jgi:hypothetical protein
MARYRRHQNEQADDTAEGPEEEIDLTDPTEGDNSSATTPGGSEVQGENSQPDEIDFADSSTW